MEERRRKKKEERRRKKKEERRRKKKEERRENGKDEEEATPPCREKLQRDLGRHFGKNRGKRVMPQSAPRWRWPATGPRVPPDSPSLKPPSSAGLPFPGETPPTCRGRGGAGKRASLKPPPSIFPRILAQFHPFTVTHQRSFPRLHPIHRDSSGFIRIHLINAAMIPSNQH